MKKEMVKYNEMNICMRIYRAFALFLMLSFLIISLSFGSYADEGDIGTVIRNVLNNNTITCDIEAFPACQNFGINEIYKDLNDNYEANSSKYHDQYICIVGAVIDKTTNGGRLELKDIEGGTHTVIVRVNDKDKRAKVIQLKNGDKVRVFGKAKTSNTSEISVEIQLSAIEKTSQTANKSSDIFSFSSGREFNRGKSKTRTFSKAGVSFCIPADWESVEEEINNTGMNGWMYRLNSIQTSYKQKPEQAYVFYFDNETGLKNITDRDADVKDIEKAIVKNIMGENLSTHKNIITADGYRFTYYIGNYRKNSGDRPNVEFIFTDVGKKGIVGVLYVFNEPDHKEDIIYLLRTLKKS